MEGGGCWSIKWCVLPLLCLRRPAAATAPIVYAAVGSIYVLYIGGVVTFRHGVMRDTIIKCVDEVGFDGVYVDQVGNGETRNCADPNHNHTINGGAFWVCRTALMLCALHCVCFVLCALYCVLCALYASRAGVTAPYDTTH